MNHGTLKSYIAGFSLSIVLTLQAFFLVLRPGFFNMNDGEAVAAILVLAVIQLAIQIIFFFNLGSESGLRWNLAVFISTVSIILVLVVGSLWIMSHLNYNMMPGGTSGYLTNQSSF